MHKSQVLIPLQTHTHTRVLCMLLKLLSYLDTHMNALCLYIKDTEQNVAKNIRPSPSPPPPPPPLPPPIFEVGQLIIHNYGRANDVPGAALMSLINTAAKTLYA